MQRNIYGETKYISFWVKSLCWDEYLHPTRINNESLRYDLVRLWTHFKADRWFLLRACSSKYGQRDQRQNSRGRHKPGKTYPCLFHCSLFLSGDGSLHITSFASAVHDLPLMTPCGSINSPCPVPFQCWLTVFPNQWQEDAPANSTTMMLAVSVPYIQICRRFTARHWNHEIVLCIEGIFGYGFSRKHL